MRLTVMQIVPRLDAGGVERSTLETAEALVAAGHRSLVVSAGGRLVARLLENGSEHFALPVGAKSPLTLRHVGTLRRLWETEGVDVVHARSRVPAWVAWLARRGAPPERRPRFVTTVHGAHSVNRYSAIMVEGERVICVSRYVREHVLAHFPTTSPERIRTIPRGIDPRRFPYGYRPEPAWLDRWRARYPQLEGRTLLTLPGRISRRKGHADFIEVLSRVRGVRPEVHGLIVGGPERGRTRYLREMESTAVRAGVEDALTFTGHRDDVREVMAISDFVFVLSSKPEAFGRVALEALSLGVPVVGYDHGGTSEILDALFPAGRVPPGDPDRAADRMLELLDRPMPVSRDRPFPLSRTQAGVLACYEELAVAPTG